MKLINNDCLNSLKNIPDNSVDSLITDPPAGICFMDKAWDDDKGGRKQWVSWMTEVMQECLRVLKPGAHGLVWAIPRTSHWTATALEDAGFEVRDVMTHIFGSGFPKSMDISKAIDKAAGVERDFTPTVPMKEKSQFGEVSKNVRCAICGKARASGNPCVCPRLENIAITYAAKQWQGWGTALKPASEHWILVRKPIEEKTVAANVLKHGTGGINIDASRISVSSNGPDTQGRFPANLVLSHNDDCDETCTPECAVAALDEQSGILKSGSFHQKGLSAGTKQPSGWETGNRNEAKWEGSSGGASRFFYCAKASKKDKGTDNTHPTVKSSTLMSFLIKLITPPQGLILDPFMGSGSTGVSAIREGFQFIGIEKEKEYFKIAQSRIIDSIPDGF